MKKIGFLSFGHWNAGPSSTARTARDVLQQSIELAVAAEDLGADGAYFRVLELGADEPTSFLELGAEARARRS